MRPRRYSINVTLDGCCDPRETFADDDLFQNAIEDINRAGALLFGRQPRDLFPVEIYAFSDAAFRSALPVGDGYLACGRGIPV
jgi:hypothetical protein